MNGKNECDPFRNFIKVFTKEQEKKRVALPNSTFSGFEYGGNTDKKP